jgi:Domain of unknown function (DUF4265)
MEKLPRGAGLVKVVFRLERYETDGGMWPPCELEGMWARADDDGHYVLDSIPMYARGVNLHDAVSASRDSNGVQ